MASDPIQPVEFPATMRVRVGFDHGDSQTVATLEGNTDIVSQVIELRKTAADCVDAKFTVLAMLDRLGPDFGRPIMRDYLIADIVNFKAFDDMNALQMLIKRAKLFFAVESMILDALRNEGLT